jgi:hypothetical protein
MFMKLSGSTAISIVVLPMTGCSLKGDAQNVIDALTAIVNADPNASWVPDLKIAIADAQTAIQDWNGTSANCELQSAITIASAIIDSIPLGNTIDLIVTIAVAGISALLADLAPCTSSQLAPLLGRLSRPYTQHFHTGTQAYVQYYGQFCDAPRWRMSSDFKRAFNTGAKASGLPQAEIK